MIFGIELKRFYIFWILLISSSQNCFALSLEECSEENISKLVERAEEEINDRLYLTLATADPSGTPWNSPLYTGFDTQYSFFWISERTSQHSQNIRQSGKSFAVFYDSTVPVATGFGVYMQGFTVELNSSDDISYGVGLIAKRADIPTPPVTDFQEQSPNRIYRFIPQQVWVNTIVKVEEKFVDRRVDITECLLKKS